MAIESAQEYQAVMRRINELMDAEAGTPEAAELDQLTDRVIEFESRLFPWI